MYIYINCSNEDLQMSGLVTQWRLCFRFNEQGYESSVFQEPKNMRLTEKKFGLMAMRPGKKSGREILPLWYHIEDGSNNSLITFSNSTRFKWYIVAEKERNKNPNYLLISSTTDNIHKNTTICIIN